MKTFLNKLRKKSLTWWTFVLTIIGVVIGFGAWFWPEPLGGSAVVTPTPTPILSSFGTEGLINASSYPKPGTFRILIARFDEEDQTNYKVTDLIVARLREAIEPYPDTEIVVIDQVITELQGSELAQEIGQNYGASVVIWGWYGVTDRAVPLGLHFEIIRSAEIFQPITCAVSSSQVRKASLTQINDLTLQTTLSNELSYVTLFTLGVIRFEASDYQNATDLFDNAINYLDENTKISAKISGQGVLVDINTLYFYRAISFAAMGDQDKAISELEFLEKLAPTDSAVLGNLAYLYYSTGKDAQAIEKYTTVINHEQDTSLKALAYYSRGLIHERSEDYIKANYDFNQAGTLDDYIIYYFNDPSMSLENSLNELDQKLSKNPENTIGFYLRGFLRYQKMIQLSGSGVFSLDVSSDDYRKAVFDFRKTIDLNPNIVGAHYLLVRLITSSGQYNPEDVINHLSSALQLDKYHTPCDIQNRGVAYLQAGNTEKAHSDFEEVIRLTTKEIEDDPFNAYAYHVRGLAYYALEDYYQSFLQYRQIQKIDPIMARDLHAQERMLDILGKYDQYIVMGLIAIIFIILGVNFVPKVRSKMRQRSSKRLRSRQKPKKH